MSNKSDAQLNKQGVLTVGDALIDQQYFVHSLPLAGQDVTIEESHSSTGGSAANTALALAYLETPCGFFGRIGDDENGRSILATMQTAGVDTTCVQIGGRTGYTLTVIDALGERTMYSYRGASADPPDMTAKVKLALYNTHVLLLSGYYLGNAVQSAFVLSAAKAVKQSGGIVALDPSPIIGSADKQSTNELLGMTDILLPNLSELIILADTDDIIKAMGVLKVPCIALKKGNQGSQLALRKDLVLANGKAIGLNAVHAAAAMAAAVVDTTGAGDAFNAGVLSSYLRGDKPEQWIVRGNALAAKVIACEGAATLYTNS